MLKPLGSEDQSDWMRLWKAYLAFYQTNLADEVIASTWSRLLDPAEPTWGALALQDGVAVGLVHWLYHRTNWSIADTCYLQDLYVSPEGRGNGYGRRLIELVGDRASAQGCERVYWLTQENNTSARALYDRVASRSGFIQYRIALPAH